MKIFEINWESQGEKEWVAADTNIEAIKFYCKLTGMDIDDFEDTDSIVEIPKSKWKEYRVKEEDEENDKTFAQWMKENTGPDIIAGTMYEV